MYEINVQKDMNMVFGTLFGPGAPEVAESPNIEYLIFYFSGLEKLEIVRIAGK